MSLAPILSIFIKGNLTKNKLILQYPISKIQKGVWQIAIDSFCYKIEELDSHKEYLCSLKCNWITNINYNEKNELISESPFIFQFSISKAQDCISSNYKTWFEINSLSEFLVCEIFDLSKNSILNINCSCYILFNLQRKV